MGGLGWHSTARPPWPSSSPASAAQSLRAAGRTSATGATADQVEPGSRSTLRHDSRAAERCEDPLLLQGATPPRSSTVSPAPGRSLLLHGDRHLRHPRPAPATADRYLEVGFTAGTLAAGPRPVTSAPLLPGGLADADPERRLLRRRRDHRTATGPRWPCTPMGASRGARARGRNGPVAHPDPDPDGLRRPTPAAPACSTTSPTPARTPAITAHNWTVRSRQRRPRRPRRDLVRQQHHLPHHGPARRSCSCRPPPTAPAAAPRRPSCPEPGAEVLRRHLRRPGPVHRHARSAAPTATTSSRRSSPSARSTATSTPPTASWTSSTCPTAAGARPGRSTTRPPGTRTATSPGSPTTSHSEQRPASTAGTTWCAQVADGTRQVLHRRRAGRRPLRQVLPAPDDDHQLEPLVHRTARRQSDPVGLQPAGRLVLLQQNRVVAPRRGRAGSAAGYRATATTWRRHRAQPLQPDVGEAPLQGGCRWCLGPICARAGRGGSQTRMVAGPRLPQRWYGTSLRGSGSKSRISVSCTGRGASAQAPVLGGKAGG